ncbi:MAG: peptide ABC transporter substrate-binding protein [Acidobacteria bacterium]|nr:peptide ABC transporter substrate-binding protein [Acidobacteriota bacterium]
MAALATHVESSADATEFTFYLRGHPRPKGVRLPDLDDLRREFESGISREDYSHGVPSPPQAIPAHWSNGTAVTAEDFVRAWRRVVDPKTAAPLANILYSVLNAEAINRGILKPEALGVRALGQFAFQVRLSRPTPFFVLLTSVPVLAALPPQVSGGPAGCAGQAFWTDPNCMIGNGPFLLRSWRPYDRLVLVNNPHYYAAQLIRLGRIVLLPVADGTTNVNIYKAGYAQTMVDKVLPTAFIRVLKTKADFRTNPLLRVGFYSISIHKRPFDNVLVRYALNMAVDKRAIAAALGAGQTAAATFIPPVRGYTISATLPIAVRGNSYDVLAYDPAGARDLLAAAGFPGGIAANGRRLRFSLLYPSRPRSAELAQILQQQWHTNLDVDVDLNQREHTVWSQALLTQDFYGVAEDSWVAGYVDPNAFLESYTTVNASGWSDPQYAAMLTTANSTATPDERLGRLADCEQYLLRAMPMIPVYFDVATYLQRPYLRGLSANALGMRSFRCTWIDTAWRP